MMNEILTIDGDVDWVDGLNEAAGLIWIGDRWALWDQVGTAVQGSHGICHLDFQGSATLENDFELQNFFNVGEVGPVAAFAQRARTGHPTDAVAS